MALLKTIKLYRFLVILGIVCSIHISSYAQYQILDSLEKGLLEAKPGFDQIDYYSALARFYMIVSDKENFKKSIDKGLAVAEEQNLLDGIALMKTWQNDYAWIYDNDAENAISASQEAVDLARKSGNKDVLVFALYHHAENYIDEKAQYDKGIAILKEAIALSDETVTQKNLGNTYKDLGMTYAHFANYDSSFYYLEKALECFNIVKDNPDKHYLLDRVSAGYADKGGLNITQVLNSIGENYRALGQLDRAFDYKYQALNLSTEHNLIDHIAWMKYNVALLHIQTGELDTAIVLLTDAKEKFGQLNLGRDVNKSNIVLGQVFGEMGEEETALDYLSEAKVYTVDNSDTLSIITVNVDIARQLLSSDEKEAALSILEENIDLATNIETYPGMVSTLIIQGEVLLELGRSQEAEQALKKGLNLAKQLQDRFLEAEASLAMSKYFQSYGNNEEAQLSAENALYIGREFSSNSIQNDAHLLLDSIYQAQGDYTAAYQNVSNWRLLNEVGFKEMGQELLRKEQVRQNVDKLQERRQAAEQEASALRTRNSIFATAIALFILLLAIIFYFFFQLRKNKAQLEKQNLKLEELNGTKDKFFSIIAHDIRSPLIALDSGTQQLDYFAKKGEIAKIQEIAKRFGSTSQRLNSLLDNLLNWALSQTGTIPYHPADFQLLHSVEHNVKLFESLLLSKRIKVVADIEPKLTVFADEVALHTIIRNLLGNAIKYSESESDIVIEGKDNGKSIQMIIRDYGRGMTDSQVQKLFKLNTKSTKGTNGERGTGLGLILVKELLEMNKGEIRVESSLGNGSVFIVNFPKGVQNHVAKKAEAILNR